MRIVPAGSDHLAGIAEIENREIAENAAHFGTTPVTVASLAASLESAGTQYPWRVALIDGVVVGFARSSPWKPRESYRFSAEIGVYVRDGFGNQGIGSALYGDLFPALRSAGLKTILAGIALPNPSSIRLHEKFGMKPIGVFPKIGFKFDEWRDVGYWTIRLED